MGLEDEEAAEVGPWWLDPPLVLAGLEVPLWPVVGWAVLALPHAVPRLCSLSHPHPTVSLSPVLSLSLLVLRELWGRLPVG